MKEDCRSLAGLPQPVHEGMKVLKQVGSGDNCGSTRITILEYFLLFMTMLLEYLFDFIIFVIIVFGMYDNDFIIFMILEYL